MTSAATATMESAATTQRLNEIRGPAAGADTMESRHLSGVSSGPAAGADTMVSRHLLEASPMRS